MAEANPKTLDDYISEYMKADTSEDAAALDQLCVYFAWNRSNAELEKNVAGLQKVANGLEKLNKMLAEQRCSTEDLLVSLLKTFFSLSLT